MTRLSIYVSLLLAVALGCQAAGKRTKKLLITFHLEAEQADGGKFATPVKLGSQHRQYFFNKVPSFTDKDIAWFYPFTAEDGVSYGAAFKLKEHAAQSLKGITLTNQGKLLGIRCSDAPLRAVLIDRPLDDGVIVMWSGLQQRHLKEFQERIPHVDTVMKTSGPQFELPNR